MDITDEELIELKIKQEEKPNRTWILFSFTPADHISH